MTYYYCRSDEEVTWMDRYVITASKKDIRSGTRNQCRLMSAWVMFPAVEF